MIINTLFPFYEQHKDGFLLSTDPSKFDFASIYAYLSEEAYWSLGIKQEIVKRGMNYSLCFGIYEVKNGRFHQAGFCRVTTDFAKYAYLADVFILEKYRGHGLGKWLVKAVLNHPELKTVGSWHLLTNDAHGLYKQFGFDAYPEPFKHMSLSRTQLEE